MMLPGTTSGAPSRPGGPDLGDGHGPDPERRRSPAAPPPRRERTCALWPLLAAPGVIWLVLFVVAPLYVVAAIVFGQVDPIFRTPVPVWNPLQWDATQFTYVMARIGPSGVFGPALIRTVVYVLTASVLCLLIAFPVAYYVSRLSRPQGPAAGVADRAVLDQLHDANVGLGQPVTGRRNGQQAAELRRPVRCRTCTG